VRLKHRRRLRRLGQLGALEPPDHGPWAGGEPPPRGGNRLEVLVDGEAAFPAIARAIESAQRFVHVAGWHLEPGFELVRGSRPTVLGQLLAEAAERVEVRVVVWAGAPVPIFHPTRSEVAETVRSLTRGTRIRCEPDPREHPFHCHHEKLVIVDGLVAFVGGIDMTGFAGDRFDHPGHPARRRLGWHDVGTRLSGPAVADVHEHFTMRWRELTGEALGAAEPQPAGTTSVQVVRTIAEGMYDAVPRGEFRILECYLRAICSARRYIYLENQFLWSPEITAALCEKLRDPPHEDFRIVILLPARANNGQDDTVGQLGLLVDADGGAHRFLAATIRSLSGRREDRLYVHAKVAVIDDERLIVGSANLNAHSLLNDTEMDLVSDDRGLAHATRLALWSEHLQVSAQTLAGEAPHLTVDERWCPIAREQLERRRAGAAPSHRLLELPGVSRRSSRLLGPLAGLIDDG
jgi:phosphatidylserine/phosphatidylglycerophosphate/cardiolipin synthase-like enzyme